MTCLKAVLLQAAVCFSGIAATKLYAAASDGNVTTLSLTPKKLAITSVTQDCQANPAGLVLDSPNRILYCLDRGASGVVNGSMNSFDVDEKGLLTRLARVPVPASGVWAEIFGKEDGNRGIATVSYNRSAASIIGISDDGQLNGPLQSWFPTLSSPGPVPLRQDRSYLHQVLLDPTGTYLLMPDLGGDQIRVYTWDVETLSPIVEYPSLITEPGVGPRHAVFWKSPAGETYLFFNGELSQKVYSYKVTTGRKGLTWTKVFDIPALGVDGEQPATTAPTSEIRLTPDNKFIIVSNRDVSFRTSAKFQSGPTDTLSTFAIKANGTLDLVQLAPSGGWSPRQFSLNKKGDLLAVGHQNNNTVVIWQRNLTTGEIGGTPKTALLSGPVVVVVWDE